MAAGWLDLLRRFFGGAARRVPGVIRIESSDLRKPGVEDEGLGMANLDSETMVLPEMSGEGMAVPEITGASWSLPALAEESLV